MEGIFETLSPIIIEALTIIILALAGIIGNYLRTWAKNKGVNELLETHKKWASLAVRTAEDIYTTGEGEAKLAYAYAWMSARLKEHGIKFEPDEIEGLIRAAYQEIIGEWVDEEFDDFYGFDEE